MGHTRLGELPKSRKWKAVVAAMAQLDLENASASEKLSEHIEIIAQKTLDAAQAGLDKAIEDTGLQYTFYLLTQLVLAAREDNWEERLAQVGINLSSDDSLFDLTAEIQNSIDDYISDYGHPSDISEMAQQAAGEAVSVLASPKSHTLFGSGSEQLRAAIRELSTKNGFADLGQKFFGKFMSHFLNFYLSRVTAAQVGGSRLRHIGDLSEFNNALQTHCEQMARIVHNFCGEWYSKTEFVEGIDPENTSRFLAVALKKLRAEMKQQRDKA
jgi:hypothetical protein